MEVDVNAASNLPHILVYVYARFVIGENTSTRAHVHTHTSHTSHTHRTHIAHTHVLSLSLSLTHTQHRKTHRESHMKVEISALTPYGTRRPERS